MVRVDIIPQHMDIDPSGLNKEDVERIKHMLEYMLSKPIIDSIDNYLENAVFEDEDKAIESFQKFLNKHYPSKKFNAAEFIIDCCKFVEV